MNGYIDYDELMKKPEYLKEYQMSKVKHLTHDEQKELFKIGESIYIRYNARDYTKAWLSEMNDTIGRRYSIQKIKTVKNKIFVRSCFFDDAEPDDLIIFITDNNNENYYYHYKSLFHPKQNIPTYKPRYKR